MTAVAAAEEAGWLSSAGDPLTNDACKSALTTSTLRTAFCPLETRRGLVATALPQF
jgi:hypothetical protein